MIHFTFRNLDLIVISVLFYIKQRYFRLIVCFIFYFIVKTGNFITLILPIFNANKFASFHLYISSELRMPKAPVILKKEDEKEVIQTLCSLIEAKSEAALAASDTATFHLGLSGGSLAKFLISGLSTIKTDWARWRLFFCDERLVPVEDGDSTWGLYRCVQP